MACPFNLDDPTIVVTGLWPYVCRSATSIALLIPFPVSVPLLTAAVTALRGHKVERPYGSDHNCYTRASKNRSPSFAGQEHTATVY